MYLRESDIPMRLDSPDQNGRLRLETESFTAARIQCRFDDIFDGWRRHNRKKKKKKTW